MDKNRFRTICRSSFPVVALPLVFANPAEAQKKPNIIHIMSDDHSFQAISAYGHPLSAQAPTPNIDRLAEEGMRFDRAYVENSLSTPSRACLMTGLYSHQSGQRRLGKGLDTTRIFVSEILQDNGYVTGVVGKWHMKCEPKGFDYYKVLDAQGEYYNPRFKSRETAGAYVEEDGYATDLITGHSVDFIQQRDTTKPFCLFIHHKAPHRSWIPDMKYLELFAETQFPVPETFYDDYSGRGSAAHEQRMHIGDDMTMVYDLKMHELTSSLKKKQKWQSNVNEQSLAALDEKERKIWLDAFSRQNKAYLDGEIPADSLAEWKYQRYVRDYLACIRSVDDSVGEILRVLEEEGILDETIVVYTSDQGFYMGEHGWFDKRFMYEESFRTPLVMRYPEMIAAGSVSDALVQNLDFAPTYLDLAGVKVPEFMEGRSMAPVMKAGDGEPRRWRKYLYYHFYDDGGEHNVSKHDGVSDKRYKLIHFYGEDGSYEELYDLEKDPHELSNVIEDKEYARIRTRLSKALNGFRKRLQVDEF